MNKKVVMGVDSSTTATKVIVFDKDGTVTAAASRRYRYQTAKPGWAEQDAVIWWDAFRESCKEVMSNPALGRVSLEGIAFTHQRFTFVPVDEEVQPLRPAILWNDLRCAAEAEHARSLDTDNQIYRRTGYPPGQWTLYKALWLKNNEPDVYEKTWKLLLVADYLTYRLTGEVVTSSGFAAMTGALDIEAQDSWAVDVLRTVGVREDIWVDRICPGAHLLGKITGKAANETGLPQGLPVFAGAGDQPCGSLGAGVVREGQLGVNGGTSCSNEFLTGTLPSLDDPNYFIEIAPSGDYIAENDIPSGGSAVMNWYRDNFGSADVRKAEEEGRDPWDVIYGLASEVPAGSDGVLIVPYLQGVYGPYWDQNARGVAIGLRSDFGKAHLVRALLEGVAYESRRECEFMEGVSNRGVEEIRMYGGSARSSIWNQLFADMYGVPVLVPATAETTALGAAISASVGCGMLAGFPEAVESMVSVAQEFIPDRDSHAVYDRYYREVYRGLYDSVSGFIARIAQINAESG